MSRVLRAAVVLLLALVPATLAGCSSGDSRTAEAATFTQVIDVRTPAEYAAGHVPGAVNMDVQAADFGARIGALDKAGTYLVYCRSGNRSAAAAERMTAAGLTVTDGGGLDDMRSAGWAVT
jgi:rhodanese-related sulfurtransferase